MMGVLCIIYLKKCILVICEVILSNIQNVFLEEVKTKQGLYYIIQCNILLMKDSLQQKFILFATSLGMNAVIVTRVHLYMDGFWCSNS